MSAAMTLVSATGLSDASGNLLTGTLTFQPVAIPASGIPYPTSFVIGGGKLSTHEPVVCVVQNGAFTVELADTSQTTPKNIAYAVTCLDANQVDALGPGWGTFQPTGAAVAFDTVPPNLVASVTVQTGPQGAQGPIGQIGATGAAGTTTYNGSNGPFVANGSIGAGRTYVAPSGLANVAYPNNLVESSLNTNTTVLGGGANLGNFPGVGTGGGWTLIKGIYSNMTVLARGIAQYISTSVTRLAMGDYASYIYTTYGGGLGAGSDEGVSALSLELDEAIPFHGTVTGTTGTGDIQPTLALTANSYQCADGTKLLNISKGTLAGSLNGYAAPFASTLVNTIPVTGVTLPLTTAWGTSTGSSPQTGSTNDVAISRTLTMTLGSVGGTAHPFTTGLVTVAGDLWHEQSVITAVGAVSGGTQTITLGLRYPNNVLNVFQGGIAGQVISSDANLALTGVRSSYLALGSMTGTDMVHAVYVIGTNNTVTMPTLGAEAFSNSGANAGFHLYPHAEVVRNNSATLPEPTLEPNGIAWAVGDVVENVFASFEGGTGLWLKKGQNTPTNPSFGNQGGRTSVYGFGVATGRFVGHLIENTIRTGISGQPLYIGQTIPGHTGSGPLQQPTALSIQGLWGRMIEILEAPPIALNQAVVTLQNMANNNADRGNLLILTLPGRQGVYWNNTNGF